MTTSIGTTGFSTGGVITTKPVVAPAAPVATSAPAPVQSSAAAQGPSAVTVDATSGTIITEFLNTSGQVQSQFPSSVAVAYLRAGLTAEGRSRQEAGHAQSA